MSKEIEELKQNNKDGTHLFDDRLLEVIEKQVNALKIIIDKRVDIDLLTLAITKYGDNALNYYNDSMFTISLSEEEFNPLKEVILYYAIN